MKLKNSEEMKEIEKCEEDVVIIMLMLKISEIETFRLADKRKICDLIIIENNFVRCLSVKYFDSIPKISF